MKKSFTLKAFAFGAFAAAAMTASAAPQAELVHASMQPTFATVAPQIEGAEQMQASFRIAPQLVKASKENARKVSAQRAEPSYGEWTNGGDMEITYTMLWTKPHTQNTTYQVRLDNANEGDFQVKISQWVEEDCDLVLTVTAYEDGYVVFTDENGVNCDFQIGDGNGNKYDCYYADHYHWMKLVQPFKGYTDEQVQSWYDLCEYLPETGEFYMGGVYYPALTSETAGMAIPWYVLNAEGTAIESYKYDYIRRIGGDFKNYDFTLGYDMGYFSHEENAKTGKFIMPIELNDCGDLYIGMFKSLSANTAKEYIGAIMSYINGVEGAELPQDIIKVTAKDGNIELPLTFGNPYVTGQKKLLYVLLFKNDEYVYSNYSTEDGLTSISVYLGEDDVDFYEAGTAEYKDATLYEMLPWVFSMDEDGWEAFVEALAGNGINAPDEYVVTTPLQASSTTAGKYRLVHPYADYYTNYMSTLLNYESTIDMLYLDIPTPNEVTILQSNNGFYWPTQSGAYYCFNYGSVNQYPESALTASKNCYGTLLDGTITFPAPRYDGNGQAAANIVAPLGWLPVAYDKAGGEAETATECDIVYKSDECYIKGNFMAAAGINTVAADVEDANAPVEFFNLQGIRVANPEAGQLLIRRQGTSVEKVIIR